MNPDQTSLNDPLRVGIVGPGRVGTALTRALRDAGVAVEGPVGRGERPAGCDAILLCVPDGEIAAAAEVVTAAAPFVGHTSGATPLSALAHAGVAAFGLHPLQTVAHPGCGSRVWVRPWPGRLPRPSRLPASSPSASA